MDIQLHPSVNGGGGGKHLGMGCIINMSGGMLTLILFRMHLSRNCDGHKRAYWLL